MFPILSFLRASQASVMESFHLLKSIQTNGDFSGLNPIIQGINCSTSSREDEDVFVGDL